MEELDIFERNELEHTNQYLLVHVWGANRLTPKPIAFAAAQDSRPN